MNHKYIKSIEIGSVVLMTLMLGIVGMNSNKNEPSVQNEECVKAVQKVAVDYNNINLTSGISSIVNNVSGNYNADSIAISESDNQTVGTGQNQEADTSICGYQNLGIASVDNTLNVREEASTESSIVGKMNPDAACEILGVEGEWTKITSGHVEGYVKSEFLLTGDEAKAIAVEEIKKMAVVNTSTLRVREEANTDSKILALVGDGECIDALTDPTDGWVQVEVDDVQGFVSAEFVSVEDRLPTAQSMTEIRYGVGVSDVRVDLVSYACQFVGNPYVWGGTSLTNGADCSGFTLSIFSKYGIYLPHSSRAQPNSGRIISSSEAKPGDLFFYGSGNSISHVAIYIGNGKIVHASNPKSGIIISNAFYRAPICVSNVLGD